MSDGASPSPLGATPTGGLTPRASLDLSSPALAAAAHAGCDGTVLRKLSKWGAYPARGKPVGPSNLIPMKTPLAAAILAAVHPPPTHALTLQGLLDDCADGCPIGLVLNLTSGPPLYQLDMETAGVGPAPTSPVRYDHVPLIAKAFPSRDELASVAAVVAAASPLPPDRPFVALHCSYGFNRTGFITVALLVEAHGLGVREALAAFAEARPPGIRHGKFVEELVRRYGDEHDTLPPLPSSPGASHSGAVSPRSGAMTPRGRSAAASAASASAARSGHHHHHHRPPLRSDSRVSLDNESLGGGDPSGRWAVASVSEDVDGEGRPAGGRRRKQVGCVVM